jgi:hypothetical protein
MNHVVEIKQVRVKTKHVYRPFQITESGKVRLGFEGNNPFLEDNLLRFLEYNVYNHCSCLDTNRNPPSY